MSTSRPTTRLSALAGPRFPDERRRLAPLTSGHRRCRHPQRGALRRRPRPQRPPSRHAEFPASPAGYQDLLGWAKSHGRLDAVGVEGSAAYGAGLARYLLENRATVFEVPRPDRRLRRANGKSDPIDAEAAARAVLAGKALSAPKGASGPVEAVRALRVARLGAVKARTAALNTLHAMVVTAPDELRSVLRRARGHAQLVSACLGLEPGGAELHDPAEATAVALRSVAHRAQALAKEVQALDRQLDELVRAVAPRTRACFAMGLDTTSALLVAVGDNPDRLRSEASFARLCGAAPVPASSGKTNRHRLHRGGDRSANRALHIAVVVRMRYCARTKAYVTRRTAEGLSKSEIMRCLKRYLAREVYQALQEDYVALQRGT